MNFAKILGPSTIVLALAACAAGPRPLPDSSYEPLIARERRAELYSGLLARLKQAGLVVQGVNAAGTVVVMPAGMCHAPPTPDALIAQGANAALEARYRSSTEKKDPPIVISDSCQIPDPDQGPVH